MELKLQNGDYLPDGAGGVEGCAGAEEVLARVLCHAPCIFVTAPKNKEMIEAMHMTYAPDLATAMAMAKAEKGEDAKITLIPNGISVMVKA